MDGGQRSELRGQNSQTLFNTKDFGVPREHDKLRIFCFTREKTGTLVREKLVYSCYNMLEYM